MEKARVGEDRARGLSVDALARVHGRPVDATIARLVALERCPALFQPFDGSARRS